MSQQPPQPPQQPQPSYAPPQEQANVLDAIVPTNPLAAVSCYAGIFSCLLCIFGIVLGPIAIVTGYLGLKKWKVQETTYGKTASTIRAWIGIVTGSIGTLLSIPMILMLVSGRM